MLTVLDRLLSEALLGFLALLSLFLLFVPVVFELSPAAVQWLTLTEYGIVGLFAVEYLSALALSQDKARFVVNRWRVLDLLIIAGALVAILPATPDFLRNSPALRLLRLGRVALLGARSGLALTTTSAPSPQGNLRDDELAILALKPSGSGFEPVSWEEGLSRIGSKEPDWLFIGGVTESRIAPIAAALSVPETAMRGLFQSSVPRFDRLERSTALFVRYPLPFGPDGRLRRTPVLLVGSDDNVVVLSRERTDLVARVEQRLSGASDGLPRMMGAAVALLGEIVRANTEVVERLEESLLELESRQANLRDETFLARTFELRTDVLKVRGSLKHLRSVVHDIADGRLSVGVPVTRSREVFQLVANDAGELYESVEDLRESLQALVDLRLNVASFQMNRVMRLLALLTALALIPATAGGLLGMNLLDTPWPATLAQVSFGVAAGMALSLYIFAIKGWMR